MDVNNLIQSVQQLQKLTNDAIIKKQTAINQKKSLQQDIEQLQKKSQQQFGCSVKQLGAKKEQYTQQIEEKIAKLKSILGVE